MAYTDIDKPSDYFDTKLYTGNGGTQSITGLDFQPNWCWFKDRSGTNNHALYDSVRGATKMVSSNATNAESTNDGLTSFNSNGFTLGNVNKTNSGSTNYASWNWKAGTSVSGTTTGSGTGQSYSGSVNTDAGFSITAFTGNGTANHTLPHSLSSIPSMFIIKKRIGTGDATARDWNVYHQSLGNTKRIALNSTGAVSTSNEYWNNISPTSSVINLGTNDQINGNNNTYICYAFAEKKGYSKFGSYTGNGNADGTFVYTGFKPAFVMVKRTDSTNYWFMFDNKRSSSGSNPTDKELYANDAAAEDTSARFDFLSNGFKNRISSAGSNASGGTYIYMAFASNPFVTSTGVPATAR